MDFTLKKYTAIIDAALESGYNFGSVEDLFSGKLTPPFVVLRHDVDRRPRNALDMAKEEAKRGIRASYYFRIVKASLNPEIIKEILALGHEIGYHYEDWHLAKYEPATAKSLFENHLKVLRNLAPINTICMHGSPLSKENNMNIWNHFKFEDYGLKDCIISYDYTGHAFFTDSGRTFGVSGANLRDELGNADVYPQVTTSDSLASFIKEKTADKIMISCHPERWTDKRGQWLEQFAKDKLANSIKLILKKLR